MAFVILESRSRASEEASIHTRTSLCGGKVKVLRSSLYSEEGEVIVWTGTPESVMMLEAFSSSPHHEMKRLKWLKLKCGEERYGVLRAGIIPLNLAPSLNPGAHR